MYDILFIFFGINLSDLRDTVSNIIKIVFAVL